MLSWLTFTSAEEAHAKMLEDEPMGGRSTNCFCSSFDHRSVYQYDVLAFAARRLPPRLEEREFDMSPLDKVFASAWLNDTQIAVGTKCRGLCILDTVTGKRIRVPSITEDEVFTPVFCSGIHSIAINPSRTLLAVGAGKPNESIQVYKLPSFEPKALLEGHKDMVFSVSWIDDETLVSGSRDRSVKVWKLEPEYIVSQIDSGLIGVDIFRAASSETQHGQKVRDLVTDRMRSNLFTLSADGFVKIWDTNRVKVTNSVPLPYTNETVCVALEEQKGVVSVGSQAHISLIDPRTKLVVQSFESLDEGWGVRSMAIHKNLITIGGGIGRISFFDLTANKYLSWEDNGGNFTSYFQSGAGSLIKDSIYNRHFRGMVINNAVYTLGYDSDGARLFSAGGPLQLNLKGSYASIWE